MARVLRIAAVVLTAGVVLVGLVAGALLYPWVRDDVLLDRVVQGVALDWRDFGVDAARTRLQYELDRQAIGLQVADDDCALTEQPDGSREVRCDWGVALAVPGTRTHLPLEFSSTAVITPDGDLR